MTARPVATPKEVAGSAAAIEREALTRISPDPALLARVARAREGLVRRATEEAHRQTIPLRRALVAGSAARGTFLQEMRDLDLFLLFDPGLSRERLEMEGLRLAGSILERPEKRYAEHPYLRGQFEGFFVDAVPGYAVEDPSHPMTAVDRTPFHQQFLAERLTPPLVDQVRLAKQFLRALGVYGSEVRTAGFSGYLIELLVLRFGSLAGLLETAEGWRIPVRLTSPGAKPTLPEDVALVLDDPVDPHRNVASALSRANLALFVLASHEYRSRPRLEAFFPAPRRLISMATARARIEARGTHVAVVRIGRPNLVDDILFPQLFKTERSLAAEAERLGFEVVGSSSWASGDALWVAIEVTAGILPSVRVQPGPPPGIEHTDAFLSKWAASEAPVAQGPYVRPDGRLAVDVRRPVRDLETLLAGSLPNLAVGKDLHGPVRAGARVQGLDQLGDSPELAPVLDRLLNRRLPWLPPLPA